MLGLPAKTELNKRIEKKIIYNLFNMDNKQKEAFDADISLLYIVNEISEYSTGISSGDNVSTIHLIRVVMKKKEYSDANITRLFKLINNKILLVLEYKDEVQVVANHLKVFKSNWTPKDDFILELYGLNLDRVYENFITEIGGFQIENENTLDEQIVNDERKAKQEKEITRLERMARNEKQPKKKFELVQEIKRLKARSNNE